MPNATDDKNPQLQIIERTGYFAVDLGALDVGGALTSLPFGSLASINFIKIRQSEADLSRVYYCYPSTNRLPFVS
jgi:hypothetical protein